MGNMIRNQSILNTNKTMAINSKLTEKSVKFDIADLENSTGSWQMYSNESADRYPSVQKDFFLLICRPFKRRDSILSFNFLFGTLAILAWGSKGSRDVGLPITLGPLQKPQVGPRGRI